jgi:murein DD-endopeptidase MepM/ murein hydrolase activator NlpD
MEDMYNIEKLISIKDSLQKGKIKIGKELANLQSLKKLQEKEKGNIKREKAKKRYLLKQVKSQLTERQKFIKELEKSRESLEGLIARMRSQKSKKKFEGMIWPCGGIVVSKFGTVIDPEYGTKLINNGIDIKAPLETLVKVAMDGRVVYADRFYGYGKMILVDHNNSFYTLYAHLSKIGVTKGDYVKRGETIGSVGTTGTIEKPALHFELRINGKAVDPLKWMGSN